MVSVIRPSRLTRQPQGVPRLSLASQLRRGLISYMPLTGRGYGDIADGSAWTPTGPVAYEGAARGMALRVKGATASYLSRPTPSAIAAGTAPPLTFAFRLSLRATTNNSGIMSWGTGAQDGAPRFYVRVSGGSLNIYYGGSYQVSIPVVAGVEYVLMHVWDGSSQITYFGGALVASRVSGFGGNNSSLYLGTGFDGVNAGTDYLLSDFGAWNRAFTSGEAASYAQNPWSVLDSGVSNTVYLAAIASTLAATPDASVTLPSAAATSAAGAITASGGASVTLPGAAASSAAGTIVATGGASAAIVGAAASAAAGTIVAIGAATVTITGAASTAQAGTIVASGAAVAVMPSAAASSAAGTITATAGGGATVTLPSAAAAAAAGTMTASGGANATIPSAAAATAAGTLAASGAANVTLPAAVAAALAGTLGAQGGASVSIVGVAGQLQAGSISAQGVFNGGAVAMLVGAAAVASAGTITAVGVRVGIKVNITEDMICKVVRDYILTIASGQRVVRTPVNKASMPVGAYVAFTPGLRMPLVTNVSTYDDNGRFTKRSEQMSFQIDCYGEGAADLAETLNTLYRDKYAADLFTESGFDIAPLYAGNVMQAPFVNDSDQYEDRYTFEIELQVNSVIEVPQQSCNMLTIELESVDANFPPHEVE